MANIIDIVNQIGDEVELSLSKNESNEFFKQTILLYSLTENLLKYLVATKICWDESCIQSDKIDNGEEYSVDFGVIRDRAKDYSFNRTIDNAKVLGLISEDLKNRLHDLRKERNDLIHELYLFQQRNDAEFMRGNLMKVEGICEELSTIFVNLIYEEIGVDEPEVLETL
jgi:hypothetical protein